MKKTLLCAELLKPPLKGVNFRQIFESLMETHWEHGSRFVKKLNGVLCE